MVVSRSRILVGREVGCIRERKGDGIFSRRDEKATTDGGNKSKRWHRKDFKTMVRSERRCMKNNKWFSEKGW